MWEVFVWGFAVSFLSCVCVSVSGVLFSVGVCVCDLSIYSQPPSIHTPQAAPTLLGRWMTTLKWLALYSQFPSPIHTLQAAPTLLGQWIVNFSIHSSPPLFTPRRLRRRCPANGL